MGKKDTTKKNKVLQERNDAAMAILENLSVLHLDADDVDWEMVEGAAEIVACDACPNDDDTKSGLKHPADWLVRSMDDYFVLAFLAQKYEKKFELTWAADATLRGIHLKRGMLPESRSAKFGKRFSVEPWRPASLTSFASLQATPAQHASVAAVNTEISEAVGKETVLEDGRTVLTVLYDKELHDQTWRLYADLKCGEHDDCVSTSLLILNRIEEYPAIDARYIELADALDILGDVYTHIEDGRFYPDWERAFNVEDEAELVERLSSGMSMIRTRLGISEE